MANQEHVDIVKQGTEAINAFREKNPDVKLYLRAADLRGANLSRANLSNADLTCAWLNLANLSRSGLSNACLNGADLTDANLNNADLSGGDLRAANLSRANLSNAELSSANLNLANLSHSRLRKANLTDANLRDAILTGANLSNVGLLGANLKCANLTGANLSNAYLSNANLTDANLSRADLTDANLSGVNLSRADLTGANLTDANLSSADLTDANLSGVNLSRADLSSTNLIDTNLSDADLSGTKLCSTVFANIDLSQVNALETVQHEGPSTIGVDTLFRSNGKIPEVFLRGCGLPETLITYLPSFMENAFDFYSCFISYNHEDKQFARQLHDRLQGKGIRCWLDEKQLKPGDNIYKDVDRGIRVWDKVLLCCSDNSLKSWWVNREITTAIEKEREFYEQHGEEIWKIIPLNLDGSLFKWTGEHGAVIRQRLAADFTNWKSDADKFDNQLGEVVKALRTDGGKLPEPTPKLPKVPK